MGPEEGCSGPFRADCGAPGELWGLRTGKIFSTLACLRDRPTTHSLPLLCSPPSPLFPTNLAFKAFCLVHSALPSASLEQPPIISHLDICSRCLMGLPLCSYLCPCNLFYSRQPE